MDFESFQQSLSFAHPPGGINPYLSAMWYDANGDWNKAHNTVQDLTDNRAAWVHAYLHRKEGDLGNAEYWYRRAAKTRPSISLEDEWQEIVKTLLNH